MIYIWQFLSCATLPGDSPVYIDIGTYTRYLLHHGLNQTYSFDIHFEIERTCIFFMYERHKTNKPVSLLSQRPKVAVIPSFFYPSILLFLPLNLTSASLLITCTPFLPIPFSYPTNTSLNISSTLGCVLINALSSTYKSTAMSSSLVLTEPNPKSTRTMSASSSSVLPGRGRSMIFEVVRSPWTTSAVCIEATAEPMRVMRLCISGVDESCGGEEVDVDVDVRGEECKASPNTSFTVRPEIHSIYISPRASSTKYTAGTVTPPAPEVIRDLSSSRRMRTRRRASERQRCFVRRASRMGWR